MVFKLFIESVPIRTFSSQQPADIMSKSEPMILLMGLKLVTLIVK